MNEPPTPGVESHEHAAAPGGEAPPPRPGLPWERDDPGRSPAGALDTVRLVLLSPAEAFRQMSRRGALAAPLLFLLVFGTLGSLFGLGWGALLRSLVMVSGAGFPFDPADVARANWIAVVQLLIAPFMVLFSASVAAAICHVMLMLLGGAPRPFDTTYRVVCYGAGAANLCQIAPFCGFFIAPIWGVVVLIIGLSEAQEVPGGRATAAVLVPLLLVCCCCLLFWGLLVGLAVNMPGFAGG